MNRVRRVLDSSATRRWAAWLAPIAMFLALGAWAMSSPVGSSPDDDFHLASIWCARGERDGLCEPGDTPDSRRLPTGVVGQPFCHVFRPEVSASCQSATIDDLRDDDMRLWERANFDGLYPPVFYAAMSVLAGDDLVRGVLAMRWLNAFLYVAMLTTVVMTVPGRLRRPAVIGAVATAVPLGMFIVPSTNPSSWAMLCAATLWVSLLGCFEAKGRRAWVLAALSLLAVVVGAGSRADAGLYAVLVVGLVAVLVVRKEHPPAWKFGLLALVAVVALLFYATATQGGQLQTGLQNDQPSTRSPASLFLYNLVEAPRLWIGMLGEWGLGWLDTPMPAATWVLSSAVFFALVFWGLSAVDWRKAIVVTTAFAALWVVPVVLLVQSRAVVGQVVQPRYILPLGVIVAGMANLAVRRHRPPALSWLQSLGVLSMLASAHALALHFILRRYTAGAGVGRWNLDSTAQWWWSAGPSPMLTWAIGSLAFAVGVAALLLLGHPVVLADPGRWSPEDVEPARVPDEASGRGGSEPGRTLDFLDDPV